jgi:hypothetical protein
VLCQSSGRKYQRFFCPAKENAAAFNVARCGYMLPPTQTQEGFVNSLRVGAALTSAAAVSTLPAQSLSVS